MSREPQAQVNSRSGNVVCDNMRVREDIILSGGVRSPHETGTIRFNNDVQMTRDFCVDGDTTLHGNLIVDGTINEQLPFPTGPYTSILKTIDLTGKVVIVTGVSRGQGRATAQLIRAAGAIVIGTSRHAAGYPTPGLFQKPAFIPQVSPLLTATGVTQTCDYLMRMDLSLTAITHANGAQALTVAPFTLVVDETTGFPAVGTLTVQTVANGLQNITYTGITATSFTGCVAGGAYNIANAGDVYQEGSINAFSAAVHEMFATGPLVGLSLFAVVQNADRVYFGDPFTSASGASASAVNNYIEAVTLSSTAPAILIGSLFDLFPVNSAARIIFMVSIVGRQVAGADPVAPYVAGKTAMQALINGFIEQIGNYMVATPGSYTDFRICGVYPDGVRTTIALFPAVASANGDIGALVGLNPNPSLPLFSNFLLGFPGLQDDDQSGKTIVQLLTMLEPPISIFTTNDIFYNDYYSLTNSVNGFPPGRNINDFTTLIKYNVGANPLNTLFSLTGALGVSFPAPWDIIPAAPGSYVNPFTLAPVDSSAVPIIVIAFPIGDPNFDFQYNINDGPWLGAGTFAPNTPAPPLYTSTPVDLSAYTGQTIKITVRVYTYNGNPVVAIPTGNVHQTDATLFFYNVVIQ